MPATAYGFEITEAELSSWIIFQDERLLVVNKPALVVCHPSKHGPWSSLVGACREYLGVPMLHMPSRLDRETSGVVVFAKDRATGSALQRAIQHRQVKKTYVAILKGRLEYPVTVDQPIGADESSVVHIRQRVRADGSTAVTEFQPLDWRGEYTLAEVRPLSGRMHQIRVHAAWLGHPLVGDKIYGPDPQLFLDFIDHGWTARLEAALELKRQALHASRIEFEGWPTSKELAQDGLAVGGRAAGVPGLSGAADSGLCAFEAPLAEDLREFWDGPTLR